MGLSLTCSGERRYPTPLSSSLFDHWLGGNAPQATGLTALDPLGDDDLHLALWCCYQLHHGGFAHIPDEMEWDLSTLRFRAELEASFEAALRAEHHTTSLPRDPVTALRVIAEWAGPPLARHLEEHGDRTQLREFATHRSAYQLKEADGHTWGIPRLSGPGRAGMLEIQTDEYGGGRPGESHAELFAAAMAELDLDPRMGAYVDQLPGVTLATDNLVSMFGLHRRLRGALVGHLALFETCSVVPMGRYLNAARRQGDLPALARFYEVHVEADAHHGQVALHHMVAPMAAAQPELAPDMVFGAAALSRVESRFARHLLTSWEQGRSSLRQAELPFRTCHPARPTSTSSSMPELILSS